MEGHSIQEAAKRSKAPKVLSHMEIHPQMGGGVRVEHHYSSYEHKPSMHEFAEDEGAKFHAHMTKHTGLAHEKVEEQGESEPEPFE